MASFFDTDFKIADVFVASISTSGIIPPPSQTVRSFVVLKAV